MWAQIIFLILAFINLLIMATQHGKTHTMKINIFTRLVISFFWLTILYCGGFFDVFFK